MAKANIQKNKTEFNKDILYVGLIFILWLVAYVICRIMFEQKLGWDEVAYMSVAKGIAQDFDFSSRTTTVQGLLKYSFPQHNHHYPLIAIYIALFLKLFGVSIQSAYFAGWIAGFIACIFIFFILVLLTERNYIFSFVGAVCFLFLPRILLYCNSGMMEIPGCALLCVLLLLVLKLVLNRKANPFLLAFIFMLLFFYKSLFIGTLPAFLFLSFALRKDSTRFLFSDLAIFVFSITIIYFIFTKFVFLPLAPMMNFHTRQEGINGVYADFAGGFFNDVFGNLKFNLIDFYNALLCRYMPLNYFFKIGGKEPYFIFSPEWIELGLFYLFTIIVFVSVFLFWKKLGYLQKITLLFSLISIISFNLIFILISTASVNILSRYNMLYLPLLLISVCLILQANRFLIKKGIYLLCVLLLIYVPYYIFSSKMKISDDASYSKFAHVNSEIVKAFIKETSPQFIFFNTAQHTTWDLYPIKVVIMDMTTEQLKKINLKLPKPIEYLFLYPASFLFKENEKLILTGMSIVDNCYTFYGYNLKNKIVVYRLNEELRN